LLLVLLLLLNYHRLIWVQAQPIELDFRCRRGSSFVLHSISIISSIDFSNMSPSIFVTLLPRRRSVNEDGLLLLLLLAVLTAELLVRRER
jgi:hypothetical protein